MFFVTGQIERTFVLTVVYPESLPIFSPITSDKWICDRMKKNSSNWKEFCTEYCTPRKFTDFFSPISSDNEFVTHRFCLFSYHATFIWRKKYDDEKNFWKSLSLKKFVKMRRFPLFDSWLVQFESIYATVFGQFPVTPFVTEGEKIVKCLLQKVNKSSQFFLRI